jgi:NitT/TauT family transport system substrate-binding protein
MKKWTRFVFTILLTAVLTIGLTACSSGGDENQKVRVAEVTRSIFYAPQYVAIEKGFFKEEGLDIELTTTWGGDKTMTTLLSGGAEIALVGSETSIYVHAQGSDDPVINFAQLTQTDGTFLVSREKVENFEWDQLKDSTFLGQRKGGMPQMVGEFVLKKHGIDPHNDLNLIQNIDFANIANAFAVSYKTVYIKKQHDCLFKTLHTVIIINFVKKFFEKDFKLYCNFILSKMNGLNYISKQSFF